MDIPKLVVGNNGGMVMDGHPLRPPFFSIWNRYPHLKGRSLVIGIIGPRGSGKSTAAARILTLNYLLKRKPVWSNMPVAVDIVTPNNTCDYRIGCELRSKPVPSDMDLGKCENGVIFFDEVNQGFADSWRSMTNESLDFAYDTQQIRKGKTDLIWTTQSETFTNPRLRFQTDIIIKCSDLSITKKKVGIGEYSRWEIWDYSGIVTGKLNVAKLPETPVVFNKPWWHVFDTTQKQEKDKKIDVKEEIKTQYWDLASDIAEYVKQNEKVRPIVIWSKWNIWDLAAKRDIMRLLASEFCIIQDTAHRYFKLDEELAGV